MDHKTLSMYRAVQRDIPRIWSLLHAESMNWSEVEIFESLDELFLLTIGEKIIGILSKSGTEERIEWVVIHPMYPEKKLRQIMIQMLDFTQEEPMGDFAEKLSKHRNPLGNACFERGRC